MSDSGKERRKYTRYETEVKIYFNVKYDMKTKVEFRLVKKVDHHKVRSKKYEALSKNISAEALCFTSDRKLDIDDILTLEIYVPRTNKPINMEGSVIWSNAINPEEEKDKMFDTAVRLISVDGQPVKDSIYHDKENNVIWSVVLESIFGSFKHAAKELYKNTHDKKS